MHAHRHAAGVEDIAVDKGLGIRARGVVEGVHENRAKEFFDGAPVAVDGEHVVEGIEAGPVEGVEVDGRLGEKSQPRDVILVAMGEQDAIDLGSAICPLVESNVGVDEQAFVFASDED